MLLVEALVMDLELYETCIEVDSLNILVEAFDPEPSAAMSMAAP